MFWKGFPLHFVVCQWEFCAHSAKDWCCMRLKFVPMVISGLRSGLCSGNKTIPTMIWQSSLCEKDFYAGTGPLVPGKGNSNPTVYVQRHPNQVCYNLCSNRSEKNHISGLVRFPQPFGNIQFFKCQYLSAIQNSWWFLANQMIRYLICSIVVFINLTVEGKACVKILFEASAMPLIVIQ